jgi:carbon storage regulator CsrA
MLVLTRKNQEVIRIGDNITVTILKVKGQAVSVGIDAPREVRIVRGELPEKAKEMSPAPVAASVETQGEEEATESGDATEDGTSTLPIAAHLGGPRRRKTPRTAGTAPLLRMLPR